MPSGFQQPRPDTQNKLGAKATVVWPGRAQVLTCRPLRSAFGCRRGKTCASRAVRDGLGSPHRMAANTQSVGHIPAGVIGHAGAGTGAEPGPTEGNEGG